MFLGISKIFFPKYKVLYMQMDEKWFYAKVIRMFNKCIASLGIDIARGMTKNKKNMEKLMVIVVSRFFPHNNNIELGGTGVKIDSHRVGRYARRKKILTKGNIMKTTLHIHIPRMKKIN